MNNKMRKITRILCQDSRWQGRHLNVVLPDTKQKRGRLI